MIRYLNEVSTNQYAGAKFPGPLLAIAEVREWVKTGDGLVGGYKANLWPQLDACNHLG